MTEEQTPLPVEKLSSPGGLRLTLIAAGWLVFAGYALGGIGSCATVGDREPGMGFSAFCTGLANGAFYGGLVLAIPFAALILRELFGQEAEEVDEEAR